MGFFNQNKHRVGQVVFIVGRNFVLGGVDAGLVALAQHGGADHLLLFLADLVHLQHCYLAGGEEIFRGQVLHAVKVVRSLQFAQLPLQGGG